MRHHGYSTICAECLPSLIDVKTRPTLVGIVPSAGVTMYSLGFPCPSYSKVGDGLGDSDLRVRGLMAQRGFLGRRC